MAKKNLIRVNMMKGSYTDQFIHKKLGTFRKIRKWKREGRIRLIVRNNPYDKMEFK